MKLLLLVLLMGFVLRSQEEDRVANLLKTAAEREENLREVRAEEARQAELKRVEVRCLSTRCVSMLSL
jgi:hypothetical protein